MSPLGCCLLVGPLQGQVKTTVEKTTARAQTCWSLGHMHIDIMHANTQNMHRGHVVYIGQCYYCLLECWKIKTTQIVFKNFKVFVLTQRSFWTWTFYCLPSLCGRPLDITDHLGLTDMRLWELRRALWPVSDRHCDCDWSKIGVLVDRANRARRGGQRASSGRARTKGVGPGWKSGGHLGGGQGT